jgi:hypothetical protein
MLGIYTDSAKAPRIPQSPLAETPSRLAYQRVLRNYWVRNAG